jgi:small-conductance mechanosensitive channel
MNSDDGIEQLNVIVDRALVFLGRPEVSEQLIVLLVVLVVSRVVSRGTWSVIGRLRRRRLRKQMGDRSLTTAGPASLPVRALESISAPLLGIGLATLALEAMNRAGRVTGLLKELIIVFVVLLCLELIMTVLVAGLDESQARRYRRRFFKPLMWIVVGLMILNHVADVRRLANATVFDLFGSPISVGALFIATLGIWLWTDGINFMNTVVVNFVVKHTSLNDGSAEATLMLVRYALILLGLAYVVGQLQLSPATIAAITGGLSVGIGFGLREVLANFISGTFMLFERSLRPGDIVEVEEQMGIVEKLSVRSTTLRTLDNEEIVIPNSAFFTDSFKSFTGTDEKVRFNVVVMANCLNDPERVRRVLHDVALTHPEVLDDPPPEAWVEDQFGNNVVSYRLHMWSSSPLTVPRLRSDIVRLIWKAFSEANIQLVFPDLELHFNETASDHLPVTGNGSNRPAVSSADAGPGDPELAWQFVEPDWLGVPDDVLAGSSRQVTPSGAANS